MGNDLDDPVDRPDTEDTRLGRDIYLDVSYNFDAEAGSTLLGVVELTLVRTIGLMGISDKHPESWPGFFKVDLAPCILKLLRRRDGGYCGELMRAADCILCTVLSCFSFALPLLLAVEGMPTMMLFLKDHIKPYIAEYYPAITSKAREAPAQFDWDGPTQFALGVFVVVFLFCIACAKVFWPKFSRGKSPQHDIDCHRNG
jgi:hypothetical protein